MPYPFFSMSISIGSPSKKDEEMKKMEIKKERGWKKKAIEKKQQMTLVNGSTTY